tara:strand:+ start:34328 stop:34672 length:345 start_codon:yes stop_codon:yes gene_type:complete
MSELEDKIKEMDTVDSKTFTTDSDRIEIPNQYKQVILDHQKSLVEIKKDLVTKTALLQQEQMKIDCLINFFSETIKKEGDFVSTTNTATWTVDDKVSTATLKEESNNSEGNTEE